MDNRPLKLGFVPLIDAAPLVVAKERGFFAEFGLDVTLSREASWANIRDKVAVGVLDAAQMLATMPLSMSIGIDALREPVVTGCALNLGGNAIVLGTALMQRIADEGGNIAVGAGLKRLIARDRAAGAAPPTFAMVHPFSTHHYELRYWLAAAGIDPDRDVRLVVVPPPQMVAHLSAGNIAGYCVGEPWGSLAETMTLGRVVAVSDDVMAGRIEKVLGVTRRFAEAEPGVHLRLIRAVLKAGQWCDANRAETAELVARPAYVNVPLDLARRCFDAAGAARFSRHAANFPWRGQAVWYLTQMRRWGQLPAGIDLRREAADAYRTDLYRLAAADLGLPAPRSDYKTEGRHPEPWMLETDRTPIEMGPDLFIDGALFDPDRPFDTPDSTRQEMPA